MRPGFYTRKSWASVMGITGVENASMRPGFYTRKSEAATNASHRPDRASMRPGFYTRKSPPTRWRRHEKMHRFNEAGILHPEKRATAAAA